MTTYLIKNEIKITRQKGDISDLTFTVPAALPLTGYEVHFRVYDKTSNVDVITKDPEDITVSGQMILIEFTPVEMTLSQSPYRWSLWIEDDDGPIHIGKGVFEIINN